MNKVLITVKSHSCSLSSSMLSQQIFIEKLLYTSHWSRHWKSSGGGGGQVSPLRGQIIKNKQIKWTALYYFIDQFPTKHLTSSFYVPGGSDSCFYFLIVNTHVAFLIFPTNQPSLHISCLSNLLSGSKTCLVSQSSFEQTNILSDILVVHLSSF